ncbi:hypothetical protein EDB81DRAFT_201955 [Dactylonectria macrodidyma]|uniref:DUF7708 domain-containing protein n=1 Tax=Dactylonectria macrodidyma TaxID=307937 RepID=A0A9P9IKR7_9HYPO|nr:hypothetical protein EDB81DRAFT_201955 [Dactylonectria macrodidyma]
MFYGQILDVIAQHHPEYVSLAWGTIKFLLVGVLNYETLVKELCKALCRVADALRHVQLNLLLYPTEAMRENAAKLYLHIIEFATRAIKWYEKRRILKAVSALSSPFQLKFRDIIEDLLDTSRSIDRLALSMSQVEARQMRLEMTETRKLTEEIKTALEAYSKLHHSGLLDTNRRISEVQFCQILDFLGRSSLPDPEFMRQHYASKRHLRRRKGIHVPHSSLSSSQLQEWGAVVESSQVLIHGSFRNRHLARDFAIDMIDLISGAGVPVVWALDPTHDSTTLLTSVDVLKYITLQVLRLNHTMLNERSTALNAARFQSTTSEAGWFSLLGAALEGLQQLYIIIDLELLGRSQTSEQLWLEEFPRLFQGLAMRNIRTVLKVAFVSPLGTQQYTPDQTFNQFVIRLFPKTLVRMRNSSARVQKFGGNGRKGQEKLLAALQQARRRTQNE